MRLASLLLCVTATLSVACSDAPRPPQSLGDLRHPNAVSVPGSGPKPTTVRPAREVRHAGDRLVTLYENGTKWLQYRERIVTDGAGQFSLKPLGPPLTPASSLWEVLQISAEGYFFRYRDFAIRDDALLKQNWRLQDLGQTAQVAGRECSRYLIERRDLSRSFYVCIDVENELDLAYQEYDATGQLVAEMTYETFDEDPDLSTAIWYQETLDEATIDPYDGTLAQTLGFAVPLPSRLPDGFWLDQAYRLTFAEKTWCKLVLTDGVQTAFYLYRPHVRTSSKPTVVSGLNSVSTSLELPASDEILISRLGAAVVAQANLEDGIFIAVGKLAEQEVVDLIEFAQPVR